jgi:hypothetical protein
MDAKDRYPTDWLVLIAATVVVIAAQELIIGNRPWAYVVTIVLMFTGNQVDNWRRSRRLDAEGPCRRRLFRSRRTRRVVER